MYGSTVTTAFMTEIEIAALRNDCTVFGTVQGHIAEEDLTVWDSFLSSGFMLAPAGIGFDAGFSATVRIWESPEKWGVTLTSAFNGAEVAEVFEKTVDPSEALDGFLLRALSAF